ncbi:MAG: PqqD family protein [Planctomycetota bacterium]
MDVLTRLKDLAVSDSGFVFDPYTGATFTVNPTGRTVLEGLKEDRSRDQLIAALKESFETRDEDDLHRDLDEFVRLLREHDILPQEFALE